MGGSLARRDPVGESGVSEVNRGEGLRTGVPSSIFQEDGEELVC